MLFIDNKYSRWYNSIITDVQKQNRKKLKRNQIGYVYYETHHIIPKCLGGNNTKDNLVHLTAREHFACHWLLTKMTEGKIKGKMYLALSMMCIESKNHVDRPRISSRQYERIKIAAIDALQGRKRSAEEIARAVASRKANPNGFTFKHTADSKAKLSKSKTGQKHSEELKLHWSKVRKGRPGIDNNSGKRYYNDGQKNYLTYECPAGCVAGKIQKQQTNYSNGTKWFNDGTKNYRANICPPGCVPGFLKNL